MIVQIERYKGYEIDVIEHKIVFNHDEPGLEFYSVQIQTALWRYEYRNTFRTSNEALEYAVRKINEYDEKFKEDETNGTNTQQ
jgi:hypothetical protein